MENENSGFWGVLIVLCFLVLGVAEFLIIASFGKELDRLSQKLFKRNNSTLNPARSGTFYSLKILVVIGIILLIAGVARFIWF